MKGIVFTGFLDMVEETYGLEIVDSIIEDANLKSKGAYTSVGTYEFSEMLQLLDGLSKHTGLPIDTLLQLYASYFFELIKESYPAFLNMYNDPIELLASVESHIHVEVLKIYPDAELPTFEVLEKTDDVLILLYKSSRAMHYFGLGLMEKTFAHFKTKGSIVLEKINDNGTEVKFIITKN